MTVASRLAASAAVTLAAVLVLGSAAQADPLKCQRTISKESAKYAQARMKILSKCEEALLKGKPGFAPPCPTGDASGKSQGKLDKAETKFREKIEKACGGSDKVCSTVGDNDALASIGWDVGSCPDLEGFGCTNDINHCGDVAECLVCINDGAIDQSIALYYGALNPSVPGSDLNKCQIAIGKETAKFFKAKSKIFQKCEDALLKGKPGFTPPCPDGDASGKSQEKLAKAIAKHVAGICKKCGGGDKLCDDNDDLTPAEIGFAPTCPTVELPSGSDNCSVIGSVNRLVQLADCVDCATSYRVECLDALGVPGLKTYPDECSGNCTPPSGPCPTSIRADYLGGLADLDIGWTGQAHDARVPSPSRVTFAVSGCAGTEHPTCGVCSLSGPIANAGGAKFDNRRCRGNTALRCSSNADCPTGPPDTGPCMFHFGIPLALSAGGVSVCVMNEVAQPTTGTADIEGLTSEFTIGLTSRVHLASVLNSPCPQCKAGRCDSGPNEGLPCTTNGTSTLFGRLSFDCPPFSAANIGNLPILLNFTTGLQTRSLSASNPTCNATGFGGGKCFCDLCATPEEQPCASDADCPGGAPCGGRRCVGGSNHGTPCLLNSECPAAACSLRDMATAWNQCFGAVCSPNPSDTDSINEGVCASGPFEQFCAIETFRGCGSDADCVFAPGDFCAEGKFRQCFTDNGAIGKRCFGGTNPGMGPPLNHALLVPCDDLSDCPDQSPGTFCGGGSVSVSGAAGTACGARSDPVVGALFCIPRSKDSSPNSVSGLPGLGRVTLPSSSKYE